MPAPKLTSQMRKFVNEYAVSGNGTNAAIVAGYSAKSARNQASAMLKKDKVLAAIAELQGEALIQAERGTVADIVEVMESLTKIIRSDIGEYLTNGQPDTKKIEANGMGAVAEFTMLKSGPKIILHNKMMAIDRLAKLSGWEKGGGTGNVTFNLTAIEMKICGSEAPKITEKTQEKVIEVQNES